MCTSVHLYHAKKGNHVTMETFKICPIMRGTFCQREGCAVWSRNRCGLIVDGINIAQCIMGQTISQEILGEIPAKLDDLTEAIKGNSAQ